MLKKVNFKSLCYFSCFLDRYQNENDFRSDHTVLDLQILRGSMLRNRARNRQGRISNLLTVLPILVCYYYYYYGHSFIFLVQGCLKSSFQPPAHSTATPMPLPSVLTFVVYNRQGIRRLPSIGTKGWFAHTSILKQNVLF